MDPEKNVRIAHKALLRAKDWIRSAEVALEENRWNDVVYNAQMGAEHAMKGILIALGITFKRVHDISVPFTLLPNENRISDEFLKHIPLFAEWLVQLIEQRYLAGYGFEEDLDYDYFKDYSPIALERGKIIYQKCSEEIDKITG